MKNSIKASIEFHFKGELNSASATIDLDQLMERQVDLSTLHHMLATEAKIDQYSYQYEMLMAEEIRFSDAQGLVADFVADGRLDNAGFRQAWHEQKMLEQLQAIAQEHLAVDDLENKPELQKALVAAFKLGKETRQNS